VFDGHDMYSDLSHPSLPPEIRDLAEVFLYDDPVIDDFHEENRIRVRTSPSSSYFSPQPSFSNFVQHAADCITVFYVPRSVASWGLASPSSK